MLRQEGVDIFRKFCGNSADMSCKDFAKLCRDCGLLGKTLLGADVDLIFTSVLPKGQRRIELQQFEAALRQVAEKKGLPVGDICRAVEESEGPRLICTKATAVRFHDDRRTYTGTHRHTHNRSQANALPDGGEWLQTLRNDGEGPGSLAESLNNSFGQAISSAGSEPLQAPSSSAPMAPSSTASTAATPVGSGGGAGSISVSSGGGCGGNTSVAGSSSVISSQPTSPSPSSPGQSRQFQFDSPPRRRQAEVTAREAGRARRFRSESPPRCRRTRDRSESPGSQGRGGGGSVGGLPVGASGIRRCAVESPQRGCINGAERRISSGSTTSAASGAASSGGSGSSGSTAARAESPPVMTTKVRTARQPGDEVAVEYYPSLDRWGFAINQTFQAYCGTQPGMDGKTFLKLCKDCNLIDRCLPASEADLIFVRVRPKGQRHIDLRWFQHALWHVAERRGLNAEAVCYAVASLSGPTLISTKADAVRFHDDRTTYTGTHARGGPEVGPTTSGGNQPGGVGRLWSRLLKPEAEIELRCKAQVCARQQPQIREVGRIKDLATGTGISRPSGRCTPTPPPPTAAAGALGAGAAPASRKQPYPPWADQMPMLPGTTVGAPAGQRPNRR